MTPDDVKARVDEIRVLARDNESAHCAEDELRDDVLTFISQGDGASLHVQLALAALATNGIEFTRWYA